MRVLIAKNIDDINTCYKLRKIVFVDEQKVPIEEEIDKYDESAVHFLLFRENVPIGAGRIYQEDDIETAIVGRICILKDYRNTGAGWFLMNEIIDYCKKQDFSKIVLGAQEYALEFYQKLGFEACSQRYMDTNIPHFKMHLELKNCVK